MEDLLELTTELDAVNAILASVGESPVDQIDGEFVDASTAYDLLKKVSRSLQTRGWHWNTEGVDTAVSLSPDEDGVIWVPTTALSCRVPSDRTITVRGKSSEGRYLYNRDTRSNVFTEAQEVIIVRLLPFEELPEAARHFITARAGRQFQDRLQGAEQLHQFQITDERASWISLLDQEAEAAQHNVFSGNALIQRIKGSRPVGGG